MKEVFINKFNNKEYISKYLYDEVKGELDLSKFDIDKYNDIILENEYNKYKDYFLNMYKEIDDNIKLDKEQIKAILADEKFSLIIAGAGTGKTTTMASKVKYLVDVKHVDPSKILVMSYTKKATEELENRILGDFNIPAVVTTFHSLGYTYIRKIFHNRKCYVVDVNLKNQFFLDYFKERIFPYKDKVKEVIDIFDKNKLNRNFMFSEYFVNNYFKYNTYQEFFNAYKNYKLDEARERGLKQTVEALIEKRLNGEYIRTIKGEIVKSLGEAKIANYLFTHDIDYTYEKIYTELMDDNKIYKPDFTINVGGEDIYIEYFGLSNYKENELNKYNKIKELKINYHKMHHTNFIAIDYIHGEDIINTLEKGLIKFGIIPKEISLERILFGIYDSNPLSIVYPFKNFMYECISDIKESKDRNNYLSVVNNYLSNVNTEEKREMVRQFYYINDFYHYYQNKLFGSNEYGFEYSDLIYYANKYISTISSDNTLKFDYIIIDEYQDISKDRYDIVNNTRNRNDSNIVAVGDDFQSIYQFSGSRIDFTYNFEKYFKGAKLLKISKTYRNSQELTDYSGTFVMRNENQIKKELVSDKHEKYPIRFVTFKKIESNDNSEYLKLKELILKIHEVNPNDKILVLGRTNNVINKCFNEVDLKDDIGSKIEFVGYEDILIDGMTMHKSKGLTYDQVIVIGLNKSFPASEHSMFWLESLFKNELIDEGIPFAEERRLFYVALTRTKNKVFLLVNEDMNDRSIFINEIYQIIKENTTS